MANQSLQEQEYDRLAQMMEALYRAEEIIKTARRYFPQSIRNPDRFQLELTAATLSKVRA